MVNMLPQFESQEWSGRIASIKGRTVYLNAGKKTGLKVGDLLMVQELGEEIIDPQTNVLLGRAPGSIKGELMVTGFLVAMALWPPSNQVQVSKLTIW